MKTVRFGIIGCGLMGREFASAAMRWGHLTNMEARPEIVALCNRSSDVFPWYLKVLGTKASARFSTKNPKCLELLQYDGGDQIWGRLDLGYETSYPAITGGIFEFGFTDAILQMWATFLHELEHGQLPSPFAGCATPDETARSHRLFTAALQSQETGQTVPLDMHTGQS